MLLASAIEGTGEMISVIPCHPSSCNVSWTCHGVCQFSTKQLFYVVTVLCYVVTVLCYMVIVLHGYCVLLHDYRVMLYNE